MIRGNVLSHSAKPKEDFLSSDDDDDDDDDDDENGAARAMVAMLYASD